MVSKFDAFWEVYPKKQDKKKAEIAFKKLSEEVQDVIIAHVNVRAKQDIKWLSGFIPMPSTFLNGERWCDDYESQATQDAKDERQASPAPVLCPGCRSFKTTARHQEICVDRTVPYYDCKVDGALFMFKNEGLELVREAGYQK